MFIKRQSTTRSLCKAVIGGERIWFIISRPRRQVVTVLPEASQTVRNAIADLSDSLYEEKREGRC